MNKKKWNRSLVGLLCIMLVFTNIISMRIHVLAANMEGNVLNDGVEENDLTILASDIIASGTWNYEDGEDIIWVISADGKLSVKGTGLHLTGGVAPWDSYKHFITSAEINVIDATRAANMFAGCVNLTNVDFINFDTSQITDMEAMFSGCSSLTDLDLSDFETSNVTNMRSMFAGCENLIDLDLSNFNTSMVLYIWNFSKKINIFISKF